MSIARFLALLRGWREWADGADTKDDGWQSDYPEWTALIEAACEMMRAGSTDVSVISALAECWAISEEGEEMRECASVHIDECWDTLQRLADSPLRECRWQVYEAAAAAGERADPLLRAGLKDGDEYCRRRAILALARIAPADARCLAAEYLLDDDAYVRQAAIEMALASQDAEFISDVRRALLNDPVEHVRAAARSRMPVD